MEILGIAGSLRRGSHNRKLLRAAGDELPPGAVLTEWDGLRDLPPFDEDLGNSPPEAVREFREAIEAADAVLIAAPEYNASIPGVLKNALDWASRPLAESPVLNKPAAVISSSTGMFGGVWAAAETRKVLGALGARVLDDTVTLPKAHERLADGVDEALSDELRSVVHALVAAVETRLAAAA